MFLEGSSDFLDSAMSCAPATCLLHGVRVPEVDGSKELVDREGKGDR